MNKYKAEIFSEFTYAESMTYGELLYYENELLENLEGIFRDGGAEHLDFTPMGDMLMSQCALEIPNREILRDMAQEIAYILPPNIRGRMVCLHKNLAFYDMFWLARGIWQEKEYKIPAMAPEDIQKRFVKVAATPKNEDEKDPS